MSFAMEIYYLQLKSIKSKSKNKKQHFSYKHQSCVNITTIVMLTHFSYKDIWHYNQQLFSIVTLG